MSDLDPMLISLHVAQIKDKCEMALDCVNGVNRALAPEITVKPLFFYLHTILQNTAAVSLAFWPSRAANKKRGEVLRNGFAIPESTTYLKDRSLRDHITHYDERLDTWYQESKNKNIARNIVGPRNMIGGGGLGAKDIFDHYVPEEQVYIFRGEEYKIDFLIKCIQSIHSRSNELAGLQPWKPEFKTVFQLL